MCISKREANSTARPDCVRRKRIGEIHISLDKRKKKAVADGLKIASVMCMHLKDFSSGVEPI